MTNTLPEFSPTQSFESQLPFNERINAANPALMRPYEAQPLVATSGLPQAPAINWPLILAAGFVGFLAYHYRK